MSKRNKVIGIGAVAVIVLVMDYVLWPKYWPSDCRSVFSATRATAYEFLQLRKPDGTVAPPLMKGHGAPVGRRVTMSQDQLDEILRLLRAYDRFGPGLNEEPKCASEESVVIRFETPSGPIDLAISQRCVHIAVSNPRGRGGFPYVGRRMKKIRAVVESVIPGALAEGEKRFIDEINRNSRDRKKTTR